MNAILTHAEFATVSQLFHYKERGLPLKPFPGYTDDQWGIKAHNRPWIAATGSFQRGERVAEVGGAYSLLPEYLAERHGVESWIIDDFGVSLNETALWQRWGDPAAWTEAHPAVHYARTAMGKFDPAIPDQYFDCVFSVSTLEHIPPRFWPAVLKDMLRITKPGGRQLHAIDIPWYSPRQLVLSWAWSLLPGAARFRPLHPLLQWKHAFREAGIRISTRWPGIRHGFDRNLLIESPDVVYRFYPPCNRPKPYPAGGYSLLIQLHRDR